MLLESSLFFMIKEMVLQDFSYHSQWKSIFLMTSIFLSVACFIKLVEAQEAILSKGSYTIRPVRILEIDATEPIRLTEDTVLAADSILINSTIVTDGFQFRLDARTVTWGASGEIVAFTEAPAKPPTPPQAPRGADGVPFPNSPGSPHSIRDGNQGPPGAPGSPGVPGNQDPEPIFVVSIDTIGTVRVDARGQIGGKGGDGGQGGNGGNGVRGRDGSCSCGSASVSCTSPHKVRANNGGTSGNGGKGGKGGTAGRGGDAVPLIMAIREIDLALKSAEVQLGPGAPGDQGDPGKPGGVGSVGAAGRPDGCCADIEFFGLLCDDASGAGAGRVTNHSPPGDLGKGDPNQAGSNVDITALPVADYQYGTPLLSTVDVINGFGIDLAEIAEQQTLVYQDLTDFNISRTFAYLLRRSISIASSSQPPLTNAKTNTNYVVPLVIADLWEAHFVDPLRNSIDTGGSRNSEQAKAWLEQGKEVVVLFSDHESQASQDALNSKFLEVSAQVDLDAKSLLGSCASYGTVLAQHTDKLVISHQISIPACYQVAGLSGIQLIVAPLKVREPLPPLPGPFEQFRLNEQEIEIVRAHSESPLFDNVLRWLVRTAYAQSITIEIEELNAPINLIDPNDIRLGLDAGIKSRYVIQDFQFQDDEIYPLTQLGIDLSILGSAAK